MEAAQVFLCDEDDAWLIDKGTPLHPTGDAAGAAALAELVGAGDREPADLSNNGLLLSQLSFERNHSLDLSAWAMECASPRLGTGPLSRQGSNGMAFSPRPPPPDWGAWLWQASAPPPRLRLHPSFSLTSAAAASAAAAVAEAAASAGEGAAAAAAAVAARRGGGFGSAAASGDEEAAGSSEGTDLVFGGRTMGEAEVTGFAAGPPAAAQRAGADAAARAAAAPPRLAAAFSPPRAVGAVSPPSEALTPLAAPGAALLLQPCWPLHQQPQLPLPLPLPLQHPLGLQLQQQLPHPQQQQQLPQPQPQQQQPQQPQRARPRSHKAPAKQPSRLRARLAPGALAWGKIAQYPWWPCIVLPLSLAPPPPAAASSSSSSAARAPGAAAAAAASAAAAAGSRVPVRFFGPGSEDAWLDARNVAPWEPSGERAARSKAAAFLTSLAEARACEAGGPPPFDPAALREQQLPAPHYYPQHSSSGEHSAEGQQQGAVSSPFGGPAAPRRHKAAKQRTPIKGPAQAAATPRSSGSGGGGAGSGAQAARRQQQLAAKRAGEA
ncbi:hypothetical protein Rsub_10670 [Raphidocelis subcapitata]|uniref:PWWP domain-containing protein n=1 Tax=Raphidocelis subcapitata TaxID=307507 RepID=A0A2V0PDS7_9CHLO|nr:hypothetical protein Rsub_10670 [Raphidocelis subcapitata]|eukprot:GBF97996.1 hypothetical protein Rsub_10670 [Raphidocelis subcapitata]